MKKSRAEASVAGSILSFMHFIEEFIFSCLEGFFSQKVEFYCCDFFS